MCSCFRITQLARTFFRHVVSWRTARAFCAVWFTLSSVSFPDCLALIVDASCARNPGSQCRCSMTKRLSGNCCCRSETKFQVTKSCCSNKKSAHNSKELAAFNHCSLKTSKVELGIARCDCPSDSPEGISLTQDPRLPASVSVFTWPEQSVSLIFFPVDRVVSALRLPPVPPPKVVLL